MFMSISGAFSAELLLLCVLPFFSIKPILQAPYPITPIAASLAASGKHYSYFQHPFVTLQIVLIRTTIHSTTAPSYDGTEQGGDLEQVLVVVIIAAST